MRRYLYLGLLLQLSTWCQAVPVLSDPAKLIYIAAEDNWAPFSDHKGQGLSEKLVSAALLSQGYQISTVVVPYSRALYFTNNGTTHACWNVTRQQSTEQEFVLHKIPLFSADSSFYYYQTAKPYRSVAEIPDGSVVGSILGYEYGDLYEQHKHRFKLIEVSTHVQLIGMLNSNKIDVVIFFDDVLRYYLQQENIPADNLRRGELNHTSAIYVAFTKSDPLSVERANALDAGLKQLHASGRYQQLLQSIRQ